MRDEFCEDISTNQNEVEVAFRNLDHRERKALEFDRRDVDGPGHAAVV